MTSQLNVDTIVDKAGSGGTNVKIGNTSTYVGEGGSGTQNTVQGLAKAWMFFDTNTGAVVNDSLNVSSITDVDVGRTSGSWTNSFGNTTYSGVCNTNASAGTLYTNFGTQANTNFGSRATGTFGVASYSEHNGAWKDGDLNDLTVHGDLA